METGSYFPKSSFGDAELGRILFRKISSLGGIDYIGLKPLILVHGSYLFSHRKKNLF